MTSAAPGAHPDPEEVDALLDPAGGDAGVAAHVAGCAVCAGVRDDLAQVRTLLAEQARHVPPEPADLGARIAAALAAEPPLTPSSTATGGSSWGAAAPAGPPASTGQVSDLEAHRRRRRRTTTWFAAAASVAVVALGGSLLLPGLLDGSGDTASGAAEDAGVGGAPPPAAQPSVDPSDVDRGGGSSVQGGSGLVDVSGTDYTAADLPRQAASLLVAAPDDDGQELSEAPDADNALERLRALPGCLAALGFDPVPRAVDLATYEGDPATVVVLDQAGADLVVVVPAGCGAGDDRLLDSAPLP